ncbi:MAG: UDP-N-acetylmuramate dehydrogenase [Candidatus Omnitrophota bacterium]
MNIPSIKNKLAELRIPSFENVVMKDFTTFRIGGRCPLLIVCDTDEKFRKSVECLHGQACDFEVIGEGSNILVSDLGIPCPVIRCLTASPDIQINGNDIFASAGTRLNDVSLFAAKNGLAGMNFASGIPGTVGGAVTGNAGAFGSQVSDVLKTVTALAESGETIVLEKSELKFSYRNSILKTAKDFILLTACFTLKSGNPLELIKDREEILSLRLKKHPDYCAIPCAGSFFKNIVHDDGRREAAGWFLEQAGCKALTCGGAAVFQGHANIIVNNGNATAKDVIGLSGEMITRVQEKFGITLEPEVRLVGEF